MSLTSSLAEHLKYHVGRHHHESDDACQSHFGKMQAREEAYQSVDRGVREIRIDLIRGSVGRYQDFDRRFTLKGPAAQSERYQSVLAAMAAGKNLGPVALYQIKDAFFILDGHHRLTAARELGRDTLQAKIVELLPSKKSLENVLYLEQTAFRDKVGLLDRILLTLPGQFPVLECQIDEHRNSLKHEQEREVSLQEAALDWYRTIYQPLVAIICKSRLVNGFPGRTEDDLYLYISTHQWEKESKRHYGIGIDRLIPRDMEAFRKKMSERQQADYPEMQRKITFFILMNVEGRLERKIMDRLMALPEVREAHTIHGSVDLLVKVVIQRDLLSSDAEQIALFTQSQIRKIRGVHSTQTLIPGLSREKECVQEKIQ